MILAPCPTMWLKIIHKWPKRNCLTQCFFILWVLQYSATYKFFLQVHEILLGFSPILVVHEFQLCKFMNSSSGQAICTVYIHIYIYLGLRPIRPLQAFNQGFTNPRRGRRGGGRGGGKLEMFGNNFALFCLLKKGLKKELPYLFLLF